MAALRVGLVALTLTFASPAAADPIDRWTAYVSEASLRFGVPAEWIRRVMKAESGGRTFLDGQPITSRAGAMGLMQLMPGTWQEMRAALALGTDPHDPHDNIMAGAAYLRRLHGQFGYPGLFAAYNAGPGRYAAHLATGRRLPAETTAYLTGLASTLTGRSLSPAARARSSSLFVSLSPSRGTRLDLKPGGASGLFVPLGGSSLALR